MNKKTNIIKVECYSGYKADERPVNFISGGKKLMIDKIIEQWRSPDAEYFKVLTDDGKGYLLVHDNIKDDWALEKVYEQGKIL
ncbi:MAG: hypothetical protein PVG39_27245 [Desulfobacteraceae bacterium]|jgi:hypothetical protein